MFCRIISKFAKYEYHSEDVASIFLYTVAPRVGAWIETNYGQRPIISNKSHPAWVRGLKHAGRRTRAAANVAPRVGAWIETFFEVKYGNKMGRTPRGCVD